MPKKNAKAFFFFAGFTWVYIDKKFLGKKTCILQKIVV